LRPALVIGLYGPRPLGPSRTRLLALHGLPMLKNATAEMDGIGGGAEMQRTHRKAVGPEAAVKGDGRGSAQLAGERKSSPVTGAE
jgi:hypothetical protein